MSFSIPESSERRIPQFQRLVRMRSNEPLHVLLVGTGPVEAIAGGADTKIVVKLSRSWWQLVLDGFFGDRLQQSVTSQAPLKRSGEWNRLNRLRT